MPSHEEHNIIISRKLDEKQKLDGQTRQYIVRMLQYKCELILTYN